VNSKLLTAHDWASTTLGAVETWPKCLVRYVSMILDMPTPAIIFWGPDHTQIYNAGYAVIMGPRHPRYFAAPYRECWPDTYPVIYPWMQAVLAGGMKEVEDSEFMLTRHGFAEEAYFTFTFSPLRDDSGAIVGILQPVFEVTASVLSRRRAETVRALAPRADSLVALTDAALAALTANANDLPFALIGLKTDDDLRIVARTGMAADAATGGFCAIAREVFASGEARVVDDLETLLGWTHHGPWPESTELAYALPLRRSLTEQVYGVAIFGVSPRLVFDDCYREFFEAVARELGANVSAFVAAQAVRSSLEREHVARTEAESASRAKDEFLAILGHELRNPLAPILTALHLMKESAPDTLVRERGVIERQAGHLLRLVDDLLDLSRITRGMVRLDAQRVALADVVTSALEVVSPLIDRARHTLHVELEPDLLVDADVPRMTQVFANLLSNAAKYTKPGGDIHVTARRDGDRVEIRVRDNGIGIGADMLPRLFEMFTQERQALDRSQGGLGLGLTIVRSLVGLHGGTIEALSEGHHRGAELIVRLPVAAAVAAQPIQELPTVARASTTETGARVLIIDDNEDAAILLGEALAYRGYTIRVVHDGPSALAIVDDYAPDIALLDIGLPVMDGYEVSRQLRLGHPPERLRLIALTGYGQPSDRERTRSAGFDEHLVKPVSIAQVEAVLRKLRPET